MAKILTNKQLEIRANHPKELDHLIIDKDNRIICVNEEKHLEYLNGKIDYETLMDHRKQILIKHKRSDLI